MKEKPGNTGALIIIIIIIIIIIRIGVLVLPYHNYTRIYPQNPVLIFKGC